MWNHALEMGDTMREVGVGWPVFEGSELADLIAFLYFLPFADGPGDVQRGADIFQERSCGDCHQQTSTDEGSQAQLAPDLAAVLGERTSPAFVAALWNHAGVMREAILQQGRPWPELSGADLRDLRAYLAEKVKAP
jgi:mono/diheme cytochrome c family protein